MEGIPHETRQPLEDGNTDFERILPGPDRMYPDTDSPPQQITRERVQGLQLALPEPPWEREKRYASAGIPRNTIHFLIRRGGARLVDLVVEEGGADLKRAGYFFGEELKGFRRAGVAVDEISDSSWQELFRLCAEKPVLWEGRHLLIREMAARPGEPVETVVAALALGVDPDDWRERLAAAAGQEHAALDTTARHRFLMGQAMYYVRGRVPASEVLDALGEIL